MKRLLFLLLLLPMLAFAAAETASAPENSIQSEIDKLTWQVGLTNGLIANKASIVVPKGYRFLDDTNTSRFLELNGNLPSSNHFLIAPDSLNWFAVFTFEESGYVKDDEKIDAAELLSNLKSSDEPSNKERKKAGLRLLYTDGWQVVPHYDTDTKRLEWGVRLRTETQEKIVNYTSRLLGRTGVMSVILVSSPETLDADTKEFKTVLKDFTYNSGETYAEFKDGDKVAQYGLAALILGGAAAVATKKGFWTVLLGFLAGFWKFILVGLVAFSVGIKSLFKRK